MHVVEWPMVCEVEALRQRMQRPERPLGEGRAAYLVPAKGRVTVNGVAVGTRDGAGIVDETAISITATEDAELVLVEVAAE